VTPEQWRRARSLFESIVDLHPTAASAALADSSLDPSVVAEVRSLLAHHSRAGAFLDAPAIERMGDLLDAGRFEAGDIIGNYRIVRELGRGGMGHVYLATDLTLGRDVAVKVLAPGLVRDPRQRARLRHEARAAATLVDPGICVVYALEEIADDVVIVSEYVDGETLRETMARGERPSAALLVWTAEQLAHTLATAHAHGVVHRDLKPENVMRARSGRLKILDFGLALVDSSTPDQARATMPGTVVGTPAYMAPEQLNGGAIDARTDLFALGVLLYEYATGQHPFAAATPLAMVARVLEGEPRPMRALRPDVPPAVAATIDRCLAKAPDDRPPSATVVERMVVDAPAGPALPEPGALRPDWWRRHVASLIGLYGVAAAVAWLVKEWEHGAADLGFVAIALFATMGGMLRGHLLFAERMHDRASFRAELRRSTRLLVAVDLMLAASLIAEGVWLTRARSVPGVLVMALGTAIGLARLVLERATTRAAFPDRAEGSP
jgi:predicted Ser/Thr protein kinase